MIDESAERRAPTRDDLLSRMKSIRAEIEQIFYDQDRWNDAHPTHVPINVDYDGQLRRLFDSLNQAIEREEAIRARSKAMEGK